MLTSLKRLLSSIVDYAGLFPPAQLSLPEAMREYDLARSSPHTWMLDRFVLPASRLNELVRHLSAPRQLSAQSWSLSVILSTNWATELKQVQKATEQACQRGVPVRITALEIAPLPAMEIQQVCSRLPMGVTTFFEIPFNVDFEPYSKALRQTGMAAKLRTGGITPDAFPDSTQLSQRILSLANAAIPFKATAGLHHPLRSSHPLTDQPGSISTTMHGFLNVAILATLAHHQSITVDEAWAILEEPTIASFHFTATEIHWRDRVLTLPEISHSRQHFFRSFGSCSFSEPVEELFSMIAVNAV